MRSATASGKLEVTRTALVTDKERMVQAMTIVAERRRAPVAVRAVIVASDPLLRAGVATTLRASHEVELVDDTGSAGAVVVIVVDSVDDGTVRSVRAARSALVVATSIDSAAGRRVIEAGVGGVLRRRDASAERLIMAIMAVANGTGTIPPDLSVVRRRPARRGVPDSSVPVRLDDREKAVLRLLADGHETAEVARMLAYSARTVTGVVHDVTRRLRLRNRAHAVAFALRKGLI